MLQAGPGRSLYRDEDAELLAFGIGPQLEAASTAFCDIRLGGSPVMGVKRDRRVITFKRLALQEELRLVRLVVSKCRPCSKECECGSEG